MSQFRASGITRGRPLQGATGHVLQDGRAIIVDRPTGGSYNVYACKFGHQLLSLDVDAGTTPMFVACPDDGSTAESRGYQVKLSPRLFPVRMIWRRPTSSELRKDKSGHFAAGGLQREWVP